MTQKTCSACSVTFEEGGHESFGLWYCSGCFFKQATKHGRKLTPQELATLRRLGTELAGILPGDLVEMILVGFYKRTTGKDERPDEEELARVVGEIQRLTAFSMFHQVRNLLKTWDRTFAEFVEGQEAEIREKIKRLTDLE